MINIEKKIDIIKKEINKNYKLYINGKWINGEKLNNYINCYNPSNNEIIYKIKNATINDVNFAVECAKKAFYNWKNENIIVKSNLMFKIADFIERNKEYFSIIETLDSGKPILETRKIDIPLCIDHFRYFGSIIRAYEGNANFLKKNKLSIILREPIGVIGQIIPWNFPILMAAWKIAPALVAGNTIIIHPSSNTSLSLIKLFKFFDKIFPPGVVNLITGRGYEVGNYILNNNKFDKFSFTGSTEIGYKVAEAAAKKIIPITLELGGKSANIIFKDADIELVIKNIKKSILFNQGQVCCAGSRLFIQEQIYDKIIFNLKKEFNNIKVGLPWFENTEMGSQINFKQLNKILNYINIGIKEGAKLICGGYKIMDYKLKNGSFLKPTILVNVKNKMIISQEEIFGPVLTVIKFKTENEVIKMANDSKYGLSGAVFTKNINIAFNVAKKIQVGRFWINTYNEILAGAPFGGCKKSGFGRETYKETLNEYTYLKNIYINLF